MIGTTIYFNFKTKNEWIEFCHKLLGQKEFAKYVTLLETIKKKYGSMDAVIEGLYKNGDLPMASVFLSLSTRSKKTLCKLNDWIKDNHYESNYELRDYRGNKFRMYLDELFEWCDEIKRNR